MKKTAVFLVLVTILLLSACQAKEQTPTSTPIPAAVEATAVPTAVPAVEPTAEPASAPSAEPTAQADVAAVDEASAPGDASAISVEALMNATYSGIYDEPATLTDGLYEEEPFTVEYLDGSELYTDLDGDGAEDAVLFLLERGGGTANIIYMAAQLNQAGQPVDAGALSLDEVQIKSVALEDGQIQLEIITMGPGDGDCCPSHKMSRAYAYQDGQLIDISDDEGELVQVSADDLNGTSWTLLELNYDEPALADTEVTIGFLDGQITGFGGCNTYSSSFSLSEDNPFNIAVGPVVSTQTACPEPIPDQETAYLTTLEDIDQWGYHFRHLALYYVDDQGLPARLLFAPRAGSETGQPVSAAPEPSDQATGDDELARMAAVNVPPQLSERELGVHILPCEPNRVPGRDEVADETYYCGVFTVPQNWDEPDGRNLDLSFVVTRSTGENPEPDPLIFLAGGPGQSATVAPPIPYEKVRPSRDIIRLDQRGTGFSQRLGWEECLVLALQAGAPADQTAAVQAMMPNLDDGEEGITDVGAANRVCWEQFAVQGLDLNQFSTAAAARDVIEFIKALEYESFNIHGVSYGTRLAMTIMEMLPMMEDTPELRSVVLDSPFPPSIYMLTSLPRSDHDFILQLLADCEADDACREAYPDLDRRLRALLDQLAVEPIAGKNELITLNDVVSVLSNPGNTRAEFVPKMIAELEMGVPDTYIGLRDRTLGTVHPEGVAGLDRSDPVQAFVGDAVRLLAELGRGDQSFDWLFAVTDALAQDDPRTALQAYVDETYGDDVAEQLSDLLAGVTDEALATTTLVEAVMGGDSPSEDTGESDPEAEAITELANERVLAVLGFATPLYNTVHCREDLQFESVQDAIAVTNSLAYPEFVDLDNIRKIAEPCPTWPVEAADKSVKNPVASDVPTLILQGAYDRRTPVYMGELAADELTNANLVLIPQQGHEVWSDAGSCAALIAAAFIADPQAPLDLSCLEVRQPRWSLPDDTENKEIN